MDAVPLIQAGSGLLGSIVNGFGNYLLAKQQQKWSEKMYNQQYQDNIALWNMQNEYNLPSAQMQRLKDAGLNPIFHGLDGNSAGQVSSVQPLGYERASMPNFNNPVSDYLDAKLKQAQISNVQSDTAYKSNLSLSEEQRRENLIKERDVMSANIGKILADTSLTDKQREQIQKFLDYADDIYNSQINLNKSTSELNASQKKKIEELLPGEKELQKMNSENFRQQWKKWSAEIDHLANEDALLAKQCKYYLIGLLNNGVAGSGFSVNNMLISALIDDDLQLDSELKNTITKAVRGDVPSVKPKDVLKRKRATYWDSSFSNEPLVP